jgi:hypothetical protein
MIKQRHASTFVTATAFVIMAAALRRGQLRWGATDTEVERHFAGDELVPSPDFMATRAMTIRARVDEVWPWIVQLGQGRGGFYSYDGWENLVGCNIHSALQINPDSPRIAGTEP